MSLFGHLELRSALDEHAHFHDFTSAMVTLFRMTTGESWNTIMHDTMIEPPFCNPGQCGNRIVAPLFWVSFITLASFLIINVVVAVVITQFEQELEKEKKDVAEQK